jgi:glyoxylase-like metal-dependent hydrolase (beta-lactamase superfamily II)
MDVASHRIVHEQLSPNGTELTSIYFRYGGNIYVFSYQNGGTRKHTLIDAGDLRHSNEILSILLENRIDPKAIERIIITHHHPDHCGLAHILAKESGAQILVHSKFKDFVEGRVSEMERRWQGPYDPAELKYCDVKYLSPVNEMDLIDIGSLDFHRLIEPIKMDDTSRLELLAIPESTESHTPDQVIAIYSSRDYSRIREESHNGHRPSDDILFSGDLWLMNGPLFDRKMRGFSSYFIHGFFQMRRMLMNRGLLRRSVREQDHAVKEALKINFSLIRVKPGHGEEFLGSRIIPHGLPADRDLLSKLGYSTNAKRSLIRSAPLAKKSVELKEQAYQSFIQEILLWKEHGYSFEEIAEFLTRIYREQTGGDTFVAQDRKQRRAIIKTTLARLKNDKAVSDDIRKLAELTRSKLDLIK